MKHLSFLICFLISSILFSQKGKNGNLNVTTANVRINEFTALTVNASVGNTTITVAASSLNANSRFAGILSAGDLIFIIQMQGASAKTAFTPIFAKDSTYGYIWNYANTGKHEFAQVKTVISATQIELECGLKYDYTNTGKVQVIRVPRYNSLTVASGGTLTTDTWNGTIGGVLIAEVDGNTTINSGGLINATGLGFRGGIAAGAGGSTDPSWGTQNITFGAEKGEGIASDRLSNSGAVNDSLGRQGRGAPANGGGGGNSNNCGGGGGANAGNIANYNGYGIIASGYNAIFNLEWTNRSSITSSGGGRGGYGTSTTTTANINTVGPNNTAWGAFGRKSWGGCGGRPLDYSTGKIFVGGGGGAGHMSAGQSNGANACSGGNGGGLIYILNYGTISGTGTISANGANGNNAFGANITAQGIDGAGGAGAGGTIILESTGTISSIITNANGGNGGNQIKSGVVSTESQGPGGGGSGGYIAGNGSVFTQNVSAGVSGVTNGNPFAASFPMNGASGGNVGINNQTILATLSNTHVLTPTANQTICATQTIALTATSSNSLATILWYNAASGGTAVATGTNYITPIFSTAGTYTVYAGSCPGLFRLPIIITVTPGATITVNSPTICSGQTATLTANSATTYTWSNMATTNTINVSPLTTTIYTVSGTIGNCTGINTSTVTVTASATIPVTNATICAGQVATLTASGATSYTWNTAAITNSINASPSSTTIYTVTGTNAGCNGQNTATVTVNALPTLTVNSSAICSGQTVTLTATGANTYTWSNSVNTNTQSVSPAATTNYSVIGTDANGCVTSASVIANVSVTPTPTLVANSLTICAGQTATLNASGATNFTWTPGNVTTSQYTIAPTSNTIINVIAANGTCTVQANPSITIGSAITIPVNNATICVGQTATLTANGATTYTWNTAANSNSITVSPVATTIYTVNGTNAGCSGNNTSTVTVNSVPTLTTNTANICAGETATIIASGATTYTWSNSVNTNSQTVSPLVTTTYTVFGTNALGCINTLLTNITVVVTPTPTISVNSQSICAGNSATLSASGATNYTWSTTSTNSFITVTPANTTTYSVFGDNGGCTAVKTVTVTVDNVTPTTFSLAVVSCPNQTITLFGSGTNSATTNYTWSNGANTYSQTVSPANTTTYVVNGTSFSGCPANSGTIVVNVIPIQATFTGITNTLITVGETLNLLSTSTAGSSLQWTYCNNSSSTANNITIPLIDTGACCIKLVAAKTGCLDSTTICIDVINQASVSIPNVFTPNGDGKNEFFKVSSIGLKTLYCAIFDRWGLKLYDWDGINGSWDGATKLGAATDGTYYYIIEYTDLRDVTKKEKGFFNLFR